MAGKRNRSHPAAPAQEKEKRSKLNNTAAVKEVEAKLEPQSSTPTKSNGTVKEVVVPLDTAKTVDSDLISWNDPSPTNEKGPAQTAYVFKDEIDIFADDDNALIDTSSDTEKANTAKAKEDQIAPDTKPTEELADQVLAIPAAEKETTTTEGHAAKQAEKIEVTQNGDADETIAGEKKAENQESPEIVSAFGRNVIFQSIKYNLKNTKNLAYWIGLSAAGSTETRQINAGNIKLEISVKYIGPEKEEPVVKKSEPVAETQEAEKAEKAENTQKAARVDIKEESPDDTQANILPSIDARPGLAVDTAEVPKKQLRDTVLTPVASGTSATATFLTSRLPVACRFGPNCSRRDTCTFDHSEGARKKMCTFINTAVGCKNNACSFSHDHLGVICKSSPYRSNCPNTHKCAFKHQDDMTDDKAEPTKPKTTPALEDDNRQLTAAEIAQKAAMARASREVSVTSAVSAPPANAPTGPQRGVKRSRDSEDAHVGPTAQRPRTHSFQMAPNQGRQQQWNQPWQQQGHVRQQGFYNANFVGYQQGRGRGRGRGRGAGRGRGGNSGDQGFNIRGVAGGA
ncbi:hypothetical protein CFE70_006691 [Pyrenophora teres f. teres 0-1]|uniref:Uncharacterized protein n=1 Tax=Pyrenophora teres f. teres (strain 0-1) TaxID=861557 RepID=E3RHA1_PYRTT|nr:hypothetical protein PTT_07274 [Pyrenophora teres f. teres 0-1]